jgi:hypothetical protein
LAKVSKNAKALDQLKMKSLDMSINYIHANLHQFDSSLDPFGFNTHLKMLSELSLLFRLYKRRYVTMRDHRVKDFILFTMNSIKRSNYLHRLIRTPELLPFYVEIYVSLNECGFELEDLRKCIISVVKQESLICREQIPSELMNLCYLLTRAKIIDHVPTLKELYYKIMLSKSLPVLFLNLDDAYNVTHTIFYLSDFGFKKITQIPSKHIPEVYWAITSLIAIYLLEENWDILGELLLCCHCLRWYPDPIYRFAWFRLLETQRNNGSIPIPRLQSSNVQQTEDIRDNALIGTEFVQNYHATLIAAMACILTSVPNPMSKFRIDYEKAKKRELHIIRARSACHSSHKWLNTLYKRLRDDEHGAWLYILLGEWIYTSAINTLNLQDLRILAKRIQENIDEFGNPNNFINPNANLAILCSLILKNLGLRSTVLDGFLHIACKALQPVGGKTIEEDLNLFQSYFLIHRRGLVAMPQYEHINISQLQIGMGGFCLEKDLLNNLSTFIAAKSLFGRKRISFDHSSKGNIVSSISLSLLHSLYSYDLKTAFRLMQTMCYLHRRRTRSFNHALDFIFTQQQPDGSFGFYAPELSKLHETERNFSAILDFYLPLTVYAIWIIVEATDPEFVVLHRI